MTGGHRGSPHHAHPPDMIEVWSNACAELHVIKTARDCDACPYQKDCQKKADKLIDKQLNITFKSARKDHPAVLKLK